MTAMKRILFVGSLTLFAGSAMAADAVVYEPAPAAVAAFNWSGAYLGGALG